MKTHDLAQGSPAWHPYRAQHWNASDAPAMMSCSPYESRAQLLHRLHTGIVRDVDSGTQRRFDDGHRFEALARPLAEAIIGEDLYPVVGSEGMLSASFDGLTADDRIAFEHKTLNADLRGCMEAMAGETCTGAALPMRYRVQMEHQCMVSGAERVLFMASKWASDNLELIEELHCWYMPDLKLRAEIFAGWVQFEEDLAAYVPPAAAAQAPTAKHIDTLPALRVDVTGMVTASNLDEFKGVALAAIRSVNRDLKTDQDFADAEAAVKWCDDVESRLKAAKEHILGQTGSIDAALKVIDDIAAESRAVRLDVGKLVTNRKDAIRADIITKARAAFAAHLAELQAEIKGATLACTIPDFAQAAKGKRTVATMQDAVDTLMAHAKISANVAAKALRDGLACIANEGAGYEFLFSDRAGLAGKPLDDLKVLVKARIDAHKADEAAAAALAPHPAPVVDAVVLADRIAPQVNELSTLNIGAINARIAPLKIDAAGLAQLGINPASTDKAAKLYTEAQLARLRPLVECIDALLQLNT